MSNTPAHDHAELIREKLVTHYGSLWKAASSLSLGTMTGGQLLIALRNPPMHAGMAHNIKEVIGLDPNCISCGQQAAAQG